MALIATGNVVADAVVRIRPDSTDFNTALRQTVASNLLNLEKQSDGFFNKLTGGFSATTKAIAATGATSLALFSSMAIKSATDLEKTSNAFKGLFGSVAEGRKQFDKVFELAEKTPFEGSVLSKDFQKFVASYSSAGLTAQQASDKSLNILKTLADSGSALGATSEKVAGFSLALTQTIGKGKLTGEEIRQMTNNLDGFNVRGAVATKLFGNSLPESVSKLDKEMKKGLVSADVAIEGILEGLNKIPGTLGASERQLRTVSGAFSTLKDIFERSTFKGLEDDLKVVSNFIVDNSERFRSVFLDMSEELGNSIVVLTASSSKLLENFDKSFGSFAVGGLQAASASFYGFSDGLSESVLNLGRLGDILQRNQGSFILLGKSIGNLSVGWSKFYTDVVEGSESILQVSNILFNDFSKGFLEVFNVFGLSIKTGLYTVSTSFATTITNLRESFKDSFDPEIATKFINALGQVSTAIIRLVVDPLDAVGEKTDGIANGIESILDRVTPKIKEYAGSFYSLGDSFGNLLESINIDSAADLIGGIAVQVIEGFEAINTYGAIAINIIGDLLGVIQPLLNTLGLMPEKAAAAFVVFKLTGSPLLTLISLFKDLDTGMIVFILTLSKAIPIIRQFQATLAAFKTTDIASNLAGVGVGMRSLVGSVSGLGKVAPQSAAAFIQSMVGINKFSQTAADGIIKNMGAMAQMPIRTYEAQRAVADYAGTVPAAARNTQVLTQGLSDLNRQYHSVGVDATNVKSILKSTSSAAIGVADDFAVAGQTFKNYNKTVSTSTSNIPAAMNQTSTAIKNTAVNTEAATQKAGMLSGALGGIPGILATIGLGVGVSLLTSHLAKNAEQANKTKAAIQGIADASLSYLTASSGADRDTAIQSQLDIVRERFKNNADQLAQFNKIFAGAGYSPESFTRTLLAGGDSNKNATGKVFESFLSEYKDSGKIFEKSGIIGQKYISGGREDKALKYSQEAAELGYVPTRGINIGDKEFQAVLAKRSGKSKKEIEALYNNAASGQFAKLVAENDMDSLNGLQFGAGAEKYRKALEDIAKGVSKGIALEKAGKLSMEDYQSAINNSSTAMKTYVDAQRTALSSTSAFYDKTLEFGSATFINSLKQGMEVVSAIGIASPNLLQKKEGREFLRPFQEYVQSTKDVISNLDAPMSQQIELIKATDTAYTDLTKSINLTSSEVSSLDSVTGRVSFAENLATYVNDSDTKKQIKEGSADFVRILREATREGFDSDTFTSAIASEKLRKALEKRIKDLDGSVLLGLSDGAIDALQKVINATDGGKLITMDYLNGTGSKNKQANEAVSNIFAESKGFYQDQVKLLNDGEISTETFVANLKDSRDDIKKMLVDSGINAKVVEDIYKNIGFKADVANVRAITAGMSVENAKKVTDDWIASFNGDFPMTFKANLEFDKEKALADFAALVDEANHLNKKYAITGAGIDTDTAAQTAVAGEFSSEYIRAKVLPEIDPDLWDSFLTNLYTRSPEMALNLIPEMDANELKLTLGAIPPRQAIDIITQLDDENLTLTLSKIPPEELVDIIPKMNVEELTRVIELMPADQIVNIFPKLDSASQDVVVKKLTAKQVLEISPGLNDSDRDAFLKKVRELKPEIYATLNIGTFKGPGATYITRDSNGATVVRKAAGDVITSRMDNVTVGEAGAEAIIPLTRPGRALELLRRSGLYDFALSHAGMRQTKSSLPISGNYAPTAVDRSTNTEQKINIDMRGLKTTDPEALAMYVGSELSGGIGR